MVDSHFKYPLIGNLNINSFFSLHGGSITNSYPHDFFSDKMISTYPKKYNAAIVSMASLYVN